MRRFFARHVAPLAVASVATAILFAVAAAPVEAGGFGHVGPAGSGTHGIGRIEGHGLHPRRGLPGRPGIHDGGVPRFDGHGVHRRHAARRFPRRVFLPHHHPHHGFHRRRASVVIILGYRVPDNPYYGDPYGPYGPYGYGRRYRRHFGVTIRPVRPDYGPLNGKPLLETKRELLELVRASPSAEAVRAASQGRVPEERRRPVRRRRW